MKENIIIIYKISPHINAEQRGKLLTRETGEDIKQ
jgi:hypothetical protein